MRSVVLIMVADGEDVRGKGLEPIEIPFDDEHWARDPYWSDELFDVYFNRKEIHFGKATENIGTFDGVRNIDGDTGIEIGVTPNTVPLKIYVRNTALYGGLQLPIQLLKEEILCNEQP